MQKMGAAPSTDICTLKPLLLARCRASAFSTGSAVEQYPREGSLLPIEIGGGRIFHAFHFIWRKNSLFPSTVGLSLAGSSARTRWTMKFAPGLEICGPGRTTHTWKCLNSRNLKKSIASTQATTIPSMTKSSRGLTAGTIRPKAPNREKARIVRRLTVNR